MVYAWELLISLLSMAGVTVSKPGASMCCTCAFHLLSVLKQGTNEQFVAEQCGIH